MGTDALTPQQEQAIAPGDEPGVVLTKQEKKSLYQRRWRAKNKDMVAAQGMRENESKRLRYIQYLATRDGSTCDVCQGAYHIAAFDFHHVDPSQKERSLKVTRWTAGPKGALVKAEADSCALLCSNCHRIEHVALRDGYTTLPDGYTTPDGSTVVIPKEGK